MAIPNNTDKSIASHILQQQHPMCEISPYLPYVPLGATQSGLPRYWTVPLCVYSRVFHTVCVEYKERAWENSIDYVCMGTHCSAVYYAGCTLYMHPGRSGFCSADHTADSLLVTTTLPLLSIHPWSDYLCNK